MLDSIKFRKRFAPRSPRRTRVVLVLFLSIIVLASNGVIGSTQVDRSLFIGSTRRNGKLVSDESDEFVAASDGFAEQM